MATPAGLAVGRVVHWTPVFQSAANPCPPIGGRISAVVDAETGDCWIHLDLVPHFHDLFIGSGRPMAPVGAYVGLVRCVYDPDGAPGTWRYPARVP